MEHSDWVDLLLTEGLILMRIALVGAGLKDHGRLAASGKVNSGMVVAHPVALGAD